MICLILRSWNYMCVCVCTFVYIDNWTILKYWIGVQIVLNYSYCITENKQSIPLGAISTSTCLLMSVRTHQQRSFVVSHTYSHAFSCAHSHTCRSLKHFCAYFPSNLLYQLHLAPKICLQRVSLTLMRVDQAWRGEKLLIWERR